MSFSPMKSSTPFQQQQEAQHNVSWVPPHQCQRRKIVSSNNYKFVSDENHGSTMSIGHHKTHLHTNSLTNSSYIQYFPLELTNLDYIRKAIDICCYTLMSIRNYHENAIDSDNSNNNSNEYNNKTWNSKYESISNDKELVGMLNELTSFSIIGPLYTNNTNNDDNDDIPSLYCGKHKSEVLKEHLTSLLKDIDQVRYYMVYGTFNEDVQDETATNGNTKPNTNTNPKLNFRCIDIATKLSPMTLFFDHIYGFMQCFECADPNAGPDSQMGSSTNSNSISNTNVILSVDTLDNCVELYTKDILSLHLRQHVAYQQQRVSTLGWKWDDIDEVSGSVLTQGYNTTNTDTNDNDNNSDNMQNPDDMEGYPDQNQSMRVSDMNQPQSNNHNTQNNNNNNSTNNNTSHQMSTGNGI